MMTRLSSGARWCAFSVARLMLVARHVDRPLAHHSSRSAGASLRAGALLVAAPLLSGASPELAGIAALAGVIGLCGAAFDWPRG